jgi:hypothetical protein
MFSEQFGESKTAAETLIRCELFTAGFVSTFSVEQFIQDGLQGRLDGAAAPNAQPISQVQDRAGAGEKLAILM